jgi:hypothetical protein
MQTLPPVIRAYVAGGKYTVVAQKLMAKYSLRIDQAGVLERELMLLLMGIDTPDELTEALKSDAKLEQQTINNIVRDLNDEVFVPLRRVEETIGFGTKPGEVKSVAPAQPPEKKFPPITPRPSGSLGDTLRAILPTPAPSPKALEGVASPEADTLLEDHEEPHIEFKKEIPKQQPVVRATHPVVSPVPAPSINLIDSELRVAPPQNRVMTHSPAGTPQDLPGAMPAVAVPVATKPPLQPQALPPRPTPPPAPAPRGVPHPWVSGCAPISSVRA